MGDNDLIRRGDAVKVLLALARIGTRHAPNAGRAFKAAADVVMAVKSKGQGGEVAKLVEAAYREGFEAAPAWTADNEAWDDRVSRLWRGSKACAALANRPLQEKSDAN